MNKRVTIIAVFFIFFSILLGAFGAHGLKNITDNIKELNAFDVGSKYLMYSGLGLFLLNLNQVKFNFSLKIINYLIILGTLIFSCFLFLYAINSVIPAFKTLAKFVPIGGLLMIIGWGVLAFKLIKQK